MRAESERRIAFGSRGSAGSARRAPVFPSNACCSACSITKRSLCSRDCIAESKYLIGAHREIAVTGAGALSARRISRICRSYFAVLLNTNSGSAFVLTQRASSAW